MMIIKDNVRLTHNVTSHLKHSTRLDIFGGFNATRIGCRNRRIRFINTQHRDCSQGSHGPIMRSNALRSSRGHHSFAVGTLTMYLGGAHCNRLMSPFSKI